MRLSAKLLSITAVCLVAITVVAGVGRWSADRVNELREAQEAGGELLLHSNRVHARLKDLMFDLFSPQVYGMLRDVIHAPRAMHLVRTFDQSVEELTIAFDEFFASAAVRRLLTDDQLASEYETARRIGERTFSEIDRLRVAITRIQSQASESGEGLYRRLILDADADTGTFLNDVRSVSYYFSETFERVLIHFTSRLQAESEVLQAQTLAVFWVTTAVAVLVALVLPLAFAAQLTGRLRSFGEGVRSLSKGDFSVSVPEGPRDEVGVLLRQFNLVTGTLATNIDSVSELLRQVGARIRSNPDFESLLKAVSDSTLEYTHAREIVITDRDARGGRSVLVRSSAVDASAIVRRFDFPLPTRVRPHLVLEAGTSHDRLSDLDLSHLRTLAEYATLVLDHNDVYHELVERRNAEYEALQAQIQPHFLFNILGCMFGLNRGGRRDDVERALICLRHMLRYIVDYPDSSTLGEEMEFARRYLELQVIRFGDRLRIRVDCDPDVAATKVPKLVLQPLVENAVVHGIEPKEGAGAVSLRGWRSPDGGVSIVITDNGVGYTVDGNGSGPGAAAAAASEPAPAGGAHGARVPGAAESDPPRGAGNSLHIGISNVRRRLMLACPGASLRIESRPGYGTTVRIYLPEAAVERAAG